MLIKFTNSKRQTGIKLRKHVAICLRQSPFFCFKPMETFGVNMARTYKIVVLIGSLGAK